MKKLISLPFMIILSFTFTACTGGGKDSSSAPVKSTYTVSYDINGADSGDAPEDSFSYQKGEIVKTLGNTGNLVKDGYALVGWSTAEDGKGTILQPEQIFCIGNSDVTLYAQWKEGNAVTYDGSGNTGGNVPTDSSFYYNDTVITALGNTGKLTKSGLAFYAWNTKEDGMGAVIKEGNKFTMSSEDIVLYAQWKEGYSVTYNGNSNTGGDVPVASNPYYLNGALVYVPNAGNLEKITGEDVTYYLDGWNTKADGTGTTININYSFHMSKSDITFYAKWKEGCRLIYDGNGNTGGDVPVNTLLYIENGYEPSVDGNTGNLVKEGYTFYGWNTRADGTGVTMSSVFLIGKANARFYARWIATPDTITTHTVIYDGNGNDSGSAPVDSNTYIENATVIMPVNSGSLVKDGYTFTGWSTKADDTGITFIEGKSIKMGSGNITLYARWKETTNYTITYYGNGNTGGDVPIDSTVYKESTRFTLLENTGNLERTGYTFGGWNTMADGSGITLSEGATIKMGLADIMLYAKWDAIPAGTSTVTYIGNGADSGNVPVDSNTYGEDSEITVQPNTGNLAKTGYTFGGWNTIEDGTGATFTEGNSFLMGSSGGITLYAKWKAIGTPYSITYDGNGNTGGSVPADSNIYGEDAIVTIIGNTGSLVKTGYNLDGWNTKANGSGITFKLGTSFVMGKSNIRLYGIWKNDTGTHYAADKEAFIGDGIGFSMVYVPAGLSCPIGLADEDTAIVEKAYWLAETELTYELWSKVYIWASGDKNMNGIFSDPDDDGETPGAYTFTNYGYLGIYDAHWNLENGYSLPSSQVPVSGLSWRDAMIFCNALTEWYNEKNKTDYVCVYTTNGVTPFRKVNANETISTAHGTQDNPYVNPVAGGFRLLTANEWELAARYIDGDQWIHGDHVSGDASGPVWAAGGYGLGGQPMSTVCTEYALFSHEGVMREPLVVKSKKPNFLGIYDMSGNVAEICFDWLTSGENRIWRGGDCNANALHIPIGYISGSKPYKSLYLRTIRLGRSNR